MFGAVGRSLCGYVVASALAGFISPSAMAANFYKWVDKNGQVHYSQTPPPANNQDSGQKPVQVKKMNTSTLTVSRRGEYEYCGDMQLPGPYYDEKTLLRNLETYSHDWRDRLAELERSNYSVGSQLQNFESQQHNSSYGNNYNNSYADANRKTTARQIMQYRCALDWSDRKRMELADVKQEMSHDVKRAEMAYQDSLDVAQRECGYEPSNYNDPRYRVQMSAWQDCMSNHRYNIQARKANLERAKSQLQQTR